MSRSISFTNKCSEKININFIAIIDHGFENLLIGINNLTIIYDESQLIKILDKPQFKTSKCIIDCTELNQKNIETIKFKYKEVISLSPIFNDYSIINILFTRFQEIKYPEHIKVYSGLEYALFNNSCKKINDKTYLNSLNKTYLPIAISMGGSDPDNNTLKILKRLSKSDLHLFIWLFIGKGYSHCYEDHIKTIEDNSNQELAIIRTNKHLWELMSNCSLAIVSGGITLFESIYTGMPSINLFSKEIHQNLLSNQLIEKKCFKNLGLISDKSLDDLVFNLYYFEKNKDKLLEMRANTMGLIDDDGAKRISEIILN